MKSVFLKELRELAWLGAPIALLWCLWWSVLPPMRDLLGPHGQTMEELGTAALVLGLVLGFAPFELERRLGMRSFLVHRHIGLRDAAWMRLAASATWTAGILILGFVLAGTLYLVPALNVPGYVSPAARALGYGALIAAPAVATGAFANLIDDRAWVRWTSLAWSGIGLAAIGRTSSRWELVDGPLGASIYLAACSAVTAVGAWLVVGRFANGTREDQPLTPALSAWSAALALGFWVPTFQALTAQLEFTARGLSWSHNSYWIESEDGRVLQRSPKAPPPAQPSRWLTFPPADTIRLTDRERLVFHPVGGRGFLSPSPLGRHGLWNGSPEWALGIRSKEPVSVAADGSWATWIDDELGRVVSRWWPRPGIPVFESFPLPDARAAQSTNYRLEPNRDFESGHRSVLVANEGHFPVAQITGPPPDGRLRRLEFPESTGDLERSSATNIVLAEGASDPIRREADIWIADRGTYVLEGGEFESVARFEGTPLSSHDDSTNVRAVVSGHDGLSYEVQVLDRTTGAVLGSSRVAPATATERAWALGAGLAALARTPAASLVSWWLFPDDPDGTTTPAKSPWIDPLVVGGRRPWLVALHLCLAAALAFETRRRLGARAWGWVAAVLALGVAAWLASRLLERRRAVRVVEAGSPTRPGWAPIADRATA